MIESVIYLLAIAGAEAVTVFFVSPWGLLCHIAVLTVVVVRSALGGAHFHHRLMLPIVLVPLLRIISLGVVALDIPGIWLYPTIYASLLVAAVVVVRILGYSTIDAGLNSKWLGIQLLVGGSGFVLGLGGYFILGTEPIVARFVWQDIWLPALILLLCTGFVEELVFRGLIQRGAVEVFGWWGIVYVSLLFAVLYMGFLSVVWVAFAFVISLYFGWIAKKTGSIVGVVLAHGICNVALYLIVPFFF